MLIQIFIMVLAMVLSGALSALSIPKIVNFAYKNKLYDLPSNRKLHSVPIPRLGGACFIPAAVVTFAVCCLILMNGEGGLADELDTPFLRQALSFVIGATLLYACGLVDDITTLSYKSKFAAQIVAATSLCIGGLYIEDLRQILLPLSIPVWLGIPLTIIFVTYLTNAVNLIDGIDGLASGLICIALVVTSALNFIAGHYIWTLMEISFMGPVITFFYFNVFSKKYKIFMGDTGSLTLGFFMSFIFLHFWNEKPGCDVPVQNMGVIAASTLVIPLLDVVRVMASRILAGRNPFLADKNHIHHKLIRAGVSPRATMIAILAISMTIISINLMLADRTGQIPILLTDIAIFVLTQIIIDFFIRKKEKHQ